MHNGNERAALVTLRAAKELNQLDRVILGTDAPAGSGVQPLGILRMISMLAALGEVPAETAFCFATGNTAKLRALDCGLIEVGRAADFVFLDRAQHSAGKTLLDSVRLGDLPGRRNDGDRWDRALAPQPQHPAGNQGAQRRGRVSYQSRDLRGRDFLTPTVTTAQKVQRARCSSSAASVSSVMRAAIGRARS